MSFSIQLQTNHGPFIMNRHDLHQPYAIVQTGRPHIEHEIQKLLAISDMLPEAPLMLDAGANIGLISIPLARRLQPRGGRVVAFEPQRLIYYMLAGNAALAGISNIFCHQIALSNKTDTILVPDTDPEQRQDFGAVSLMAKEANGVFVQALPIDNLGLDRLDLIKLDVEGMELVVLEGALETIAQFRPLIWIEIWPANYESVTRWMHEHDYNLLTFDALNFCAIPTEKHEQFPLNLPAFDGTTNPFFVEAFGHDGSGASNP